MPGNRYRRAHRGHKQAQTTKMNETVKERSLEDVASRIYRESADIGSAFDAMVATVKSDPRLTAEAIRFACVETLLRLEKAHRGITEDITHVTAGADVKSAQGYHQTPVQPTPQPTLRPSRSWLFGSKIADAIQALKG